MNGSPLRVLMIEDSLTDAMLVQGELRRSCFAAFKVTRVDSLAAGLSLLSDKDFDVVLLDLLLPDSVDIETVRAVHGAEPNVPIVVLSSIQDEAVAVDAIRNGAQDYIIKGHLDGDVLALSLRLAIERHQRDFTELARSLD